MVSQYIIKGSTLKGVALVPPSKSQTLRGILLGALATGQTLIHNYLKCNDSTAMIGACRNFGASIEVFPDYLQIEGVKGKISATEDVINAGNSGIVLRFCSAVGALSSRPVVITGDWSIRHQRPMQHLLDGLVQLGVKAVSMRGDGYAPVIIQGPICPGSATISGEDSQPVSAMLIASAFASGPVEICVNNPGEKPWVGVTLDWFHRLGIPYENHGFTSYRVPGNAKISGFHYTVPGDFSSAAFLMAAALITQSELTLHQIDMKDAQGDKKLIDVFRQMGASLKIDEKSRTLSVGKGTLSGVEIDVNDFIDGITILAVVACFAKGKTRIYNGAVARKKECNRIAAIVTELKKLSADITETDDGLVVRQSSLVGSLVHSHDDHRMAMSLAVAGLGASGETIVSSTECVAKTFPGFLYDFQQLGADIKDHHGK